MLALLAAASPIVVESLPMPTIAWTLAEGARFAAILAGDGTLDVWSVAPKTLRARLFRRLRTPPWSPWSGGAPGFVAVSLDGAYVSVRRPQGGFDVRRTDDGRIVRRIEVPNPAASWNTRWLPSGRGVLVEVARGGVSRLVTLGGNTTDLPVGPPWAFPPGGGAVLGRSGSGLALVDLATGRVRRRFADASESFEPYAFSPDGRLLASAGEDPKWGGPQLGPGDPVPTEAAYAHYLKIKVWRVADGRRLRLLDGSWSPNGDGSLYFLGRRLVAPEIGLILDVPTGRAEHLAPLDPAPLGLLFLPPLPADPLRRRPVRFPMNPALGRFVAASPDGRLLAAQEFREDLRGATRVLVWDLLRRTLLRRIDVPQVRNLGALSFAPGGRLTVEGSNGWREVLLDARGRLVARGVPANPAHRGRVSWPVEVLSRDGRRRFLVGASGLEVRDAASGGRLTSVAETDLPGEVGIAALPDGGFAVSRRRKDVRLFDADARLVTTLVAFPGSGWAGWTPGGKAWGSPDGLARLRRVEGDRLMPVARP